LKWLQETEKATIEEDKAKLRWLQPFLRTKYLDSIDRELVADLARIKAEQSSPPTANRYLALVRAILRKAAFEWEWIDRVPKVKLYREARRRIRWITPEQVQTLLRELPAHQVDIVLFALSTGLRQSNVLELEWSQVDLARRVAWIHADQAKGRRSIHVSLSSIAVAVLVRQVGKHPERVFTYNGKPIAWANTLAWRQALKRAGIEDFRWHDLRHTLGELAGAAWDAVVRGAGDGFLGIRRDGAAVCAPGSGASCGACRSDLRTTRGHKFGTSCQRKRPERELEP